MLSSGQEACTGLPEVATGSGITNGEESLNTGQRKESNRAETLEATFRFKFLSGFLFYNSLASDRLQGHGTLVEG